MISMFCMASEYRYVFMLHCLLSAIITLYSDSVYILHVT